MLDTIEPGAATVRRIYVVALGRNKLEDPAGDLEDIEQAFGAV